MPVYLGADLGGTNFRVGLRSTDSPAGVLLAQESVPASGEWSPEDVVRITSKLLARMEAQHPLVELKMRGIGFGITGDIDPVRGTCHSMKRFPRLEDAPLADLLREAFSVSAFLLNDGLAATLAEQRAGAGRGVRDFVMITLGTGIGGGVVIDGRLLAGERGRIGKVGHMILDLDGPVHCHCGLAGCWQTLAGKQGIIERARAAANRTPESALAHAIREGEEPDLKAVSDLATARDPAARSVMEQTGFYVGVGLANLVKLFAPERLVIGGGIAERNELLLATAQETVRRYAIKPYQDVPVVAAELGKDAGVVGATFVAEGNA